MWLVNYNRQLLRQRIHLFQLSQAFFSIFSILFLFISNTSHSGQKTTEITFRNKTILDVFVFGWFLQHLFYLLEINFCFVCVKIRWASLDCCTYKMNRTVFAFDIYVFSITNNLSGSYSFEFMFSFDVLAISKHSNSISLKCVWIVIHFGVEPKTINLK